MGRWKVSVKEPRPEKDGHNWILRARPPRDLPGEDEIWKSSGTRDRDLAEKLAADFERDLNALVDMGTNPTFGAIYEQHLVFREADPETAKNTQRSYRNAIPALSRTPLWNMPASKLDKAAVLLAQDVLKIGLRASTVNLYLTTLGKRAWTWAVERKLVARPWPEHVDPLKVGRARKRPFTDDEVRLILEQIKARAGGRWYGFFCLQADAAARIDAVCKLRGRDIDYKASEITLTTKGRVVTVAVPRETLDLIPKVAPDEFLFRAARGGPVRRETPYGVFAKALRDSGITDAEKLDTHSFRRRWIMCAHRAGVPLAVAMKHTGHVDLKVHMAYQANAVGDNQHEAARRVYERRLAPLPKPLPGTTDLGGVEVTSS